MDTRTPASLLLITGVSLVGCGQPTLMPTPVAFEDGADPIAQTPASDRETTGEVFIVTDRTPSGRTDDPGRFYSNDRDHGLRVGVATVDLARDMTWDELHAQALRAKREHEPSLAFSGYEEFGSLWTDIPPLDAASVEDPVVTARFAAALRADLAESELNEIYIFVHGFNTKLLRNTEIAAELHYYLGRRGAIISYEWPSRGSLFKYEADKAAAAYSVRYFRQLMAFLARETDASINVIAHSAGAPVAVGGIRELCLMHFDEGTAEVQRRYRIGHLMLVAPDMDLGQFENCIHDEILGVPQKMTIYMSTRDKALSFSAWIFGFARLGEALTELTATNLEFLRHHPGVEIVDVKAAEKHHGSWLGHSYFHQDPWVSSDVIMSLRYDAPPDQRGLVHPAGTPVWGFPADYPQRARSAAARLYDEGSPEVTLTPGTAPTPRARSAGR
jgi:esterase/lipase superfamily enzyme